MEPEPAARRPDRRGLRDSAGRAARSAASLARARVGLLTVEAAEAREVSRTLAVFAGVGLVATAAGYTMLLTAAAHHAASSWFGGSLVPPAVALAVLHLFVGILLLVATVSRARRARFFAETLDQFENDREWLNELQDDLRRPD